MRIGALRLFPAIRAEPEETVIAATGVSCRQQIEHGTGRPAGTRWKSSAGHCPFPAIEGGPCPVEPKGVSPLSWAVRSAEGCLPGAAPAAPVAAGRLFRPQSTLGRWGGGPAVPVVPTQA